MSSPSGALMPIVHVRPPETVVHSGDVALTSNETATPGVVTPTAVVFKSEKLIEVVVGSIVCVWREALESVVAGILMENDAGARPLPAGGAVAMGADEARVGGVPELPPPPPH